MMNIGDGDTNSKTFCNKKINKFQVGCSRVGANQLASELQLGLVSDRYSFKYLLDPIQT
jgi:hypothetical protein